MIKISVKPRIWS